MLSKADEAVAQRDPALPGLSTLLDGEAMGDRLHSLFPDSDRVHVEPSYIRYKPGTNCLVAYTVSSGCYSFLMYAKAYTVESKKLNVGTVSAASTVSTLVWSDIATQISIFPRDPRLSALATLSDPATRSQLLQTALPSAPEFWEAELQHLHYKPERRYVARLTTRHGTHAVIKLYEADEFESARHGASVAAENQVLNQPRLLGESTQHRCLVFAWVPGTTVLELLRTQRIDDNMIAVLAQASARLHLVTKPQNQLQRRTPHTDIDRLYAAIKGIIAVCPQWSERLEHLCTPLIQALRELPTRIGFLHGDFKPDQVIWTDDALTFIDFDQASSGDYAADLGSFLAQVERGALVRQWSATETERFKDALLTAYASAADPSPARRIQIYMALNLLLLAPLEFRNRVPDWLDSTNAILKRTEEIIRNVQSFAQ